MGKRVGYDLLFAFLITFCVQLLPVSSRFPVLLDFHKDIVLVPDLLLNLLCLLS